jgi:hypothetical protein
VTAPSTTIACPLREFGIIAREEERHSCDIFLTPGARPRLKAGKQLRRDLLAARNPIVGKWCRDQSRA